jgi:ATP-dependent helicase/DNAse subunit B
MSDKSAPPPQKEPAKKKVFLSASRIDTYLNCSALYWARYHLKVPDTGNDGARRGSVAHEVLEILLNKRHKHIYDAAIQHDCCTEVPALWRLILRFAKRFGVDDKKNLKMIEGFIMTGLKNEFFGPSNTVRVEAEKEFSLEIDKPELGIKYLARGFIDKSVFICEGDEAKIKTCDYKSSKEKFEGEKEAFNIQAMLYQNALRYLYPEIKKREFSFLFLKFPKEPWQNQHSLTDDELDGFAPTTEDLSATM